MKYRIIGKVDGIDYGVYEGESWQEAVKNMLDDGGVPDNNYEIYNFYVEEIEE